MSRESYQELSAALLGEQSDLPASEAHGCLSGALCASGVYTLQEWLEELLPDADGRDPAAPGIVGLAAVFESTRSLLAEGDMRFEPLLPDDDTPLDGRTAALAQWCAGFLFGFGSTGHARAAALPAPVVETLEAFTRFAQAAVDPDADLEEQEAAFAELVEFVRASTQLAYEELHAQRTGQAPGRQPH